MLLKEYDGLSCEMADFNNWLIAMGRLRASDDALELHDVSGHLPILPMKMMVKLSVRGSKWGTRVLAGVVYISNREFCRITDIKNVAEYEKRRFFRLAVDHSATIILPSNEEALSEEEKTEVRSPARVRDVSLCGMQIETGLCLLEGERIKIRIALVLDEEELDLTVRRIIRRDEKISWYGGELMEMSAIAEQHLSAFILGQQQAQIRRVRGR